MPYNGLVRVFVNNNVAEKTATLLKYEKTFFKRTRKILSC